MAKNSNKDKAMAAYLKENNVVRSSANCPICHSEVSLKGLANHIVLHK